MLAQLHGPVLSAQLEKQFPGHHGNGPIALRALYCLVDA